MAYLITHFYPGATKQQYIATVDAVHPAGDLPRGQVFHAAGPTEGGWLVVAVWESKEACDRFVADILMPKLPTIEGGVVGPPEERSMVVDTLHTPGPPVDGFLTS